MSPMEGASSNGEVQGCTSNGSSKSTRTYLHQTDDYDEVSSSSSSSSDHVVLETLRNHREMIREMTRNYRVSAFVLRWDLDSKHQISKTDCKGDSTQPEPSIGSTTPWIAKPSESPSKRRHHIMLSPTADTRHTKPFASAVETKSLPEDGVIVGENVARRVVRYDDEDFSRLLAVASSRQKQSDMLENEKSSAPNQIIPSTSVFLDEPAGANDGNAPESSHTRFFDSYEDPRYYSAVHSSDDKNDEEFFDCVTDPENNNATELGSTPITIEEHPSMLMSDSHSLARVDHYERDTIDESSSQTVIQETPAMPLTMEQDLDSGSVHGESDPVFVPILDRSDDGDDSDVGNRPSEVENESHNDSILSSERAVVNKQETDKWCDFLDTCLTIQGNSPASSRSETGGEEKTSPVVRNFSDKESPHFSEDKNSLPNRTISPSSNESSDDGRAFVDIDSDHQYLQFLEDQRRKNEEGTSTSEFVVAGDLGVVEDEMIHTSMAIENSTTLPAEAFLTVGSALNRSGEIIENIRRGYMSPRRRNDESGLMVDSHLNPETLYSNSTLKKEESTTIGEASDTKMGARDIQNEHYNARFAHLSASRVDSDRDLDPNKIQFGGLPGGNKQHSTSISDQASFVDDIQQKPPIPQEQKEDALEHHDLNEMDPELLAEGDKLKIDNILEDFLEKMDTLDSGSERQLKQEDSELHEYESQYSSSRGSEHCCAVEESNFETTEKEHSMHSQDNSSNEFEGIRKVNISSEIVEVGSQSHGEQNINQLNAVLDDSMESIIVQSRDLSSNEAASNPSATHSEGAKTSFSPLKCEKEEIDAMLADFLQTMGSIDDDLIFGSDNTTRRPPSMSAEYTQKIVSSFPSMTFPGTASPSPTRTTRTLVENAPTLRNFLENPDESGTRDRSNVELRHDITTVDSNVDSPAKQESMVSPKTDKTVISSPLHEVSSSLSVVSVATDTIGTPLSGSVIRSPLKRFGDSHSDFASPSRSVAEKGLFGSSTTTLVEENSKFSPDRSELSTESERPSKVKTKNVFVLPSFTPLTESRSRITSPDLSQSLSNVDSLYPAVTSELDSSRPDDPVATALSQSVPENKGADIICDGPLHPDKAELLRGVATWDASYPTVTSQFDSSRPDDVVANALSQNTPENKGADIICDGPLDPDKAELLRGVAPSDASSTEKAENSTPESLSRNKMPASPERNVDADSKPIPEFDQHSVSDMSGSVDASPPLENSDDFPDYENGVAAQDLPMLFSYSGDSDEHPRRTSIKTKESRIEDPDKSFSIATPPVVRSEPVKPFSEQMFESAETSARDPSSRTTDPDSTIPFRRTQERFGKDRSPHRENVSRRPPGTPHLVETSRSPFFSQSVGGRSSTVDSVTSWYTSPNRYSAMEASPLRPNYSANRKSDGNDEDAVSPLRGITNSGIGTPLGHIDEKRANSVVAYQPQYSSPKRSTSTVMSESALSTPLRGFHSLASPPRSPALSLFSKMPKGAARSAIRKLQLEDEINQTVVEDVFKSIEQASLRVCTNKFVFKLHDKLGPCDRCWALASPEDREEFQTKGNHLRIAKTRSGCDETCSIFPPVDDGSTKTPVRLCRRCFFATHQQGSGCRLEVYRGNNMKIRPSSYSR